MKLEQSKQSFNEEIELMRIRIEFTNKIILFFVNLLFLSYGFYIYVIQPPQYAVPSGGSIMKGEVEVAQTIFGVIGLYLLAGVIIVSSIVLCCCFKKCKTEEDKKKVWFELCWNIFKLWKMIEDEA